MTNRFVRSGGDGGSWTGTFATLSLALAAGAAGDDFYVSEDHSETQASALTPTSPGTAATPCKVLCANHTGSFPPVSADLTTGARIATTGASDISLAGFVSLCRGITFSAGDGANSARILTNDWSLKFCSLVLNNTASASFFKGGSHISNWDNTTLQFGAGGQILHNVGGQLNWKNTPNAIQGATLPGNLINFSQGSAGVYRLRGVDLSALSGKTFLNAASGTTFLDISLEDCTLPASFTLYSGTATNPTQSIRTTRSANGAANFNQTLDNYYGSQSVETTIVRSGGATDNTTPISWKLNTATAAKSQWTAPFVSLPIYIWNDVAGANVTLTVFGIWGGGAVPNNDDIWLEIDYLGSSSSPQATIINTSKADYLAAHAALASDTSTWGGSVTPFKMVALLDTTHNPQPGMKGPIVVRINVAAQSTFYIDPKVVLS